MIAHELMIGDWVLFHDSGWDSDGTKWHEDRICRIVSLGDGPRLEWTDDGEREEWPHASYCDIEPIPLTSGILEANGFRKFNFQDIEKQHQWRWWLNKLASVSLWCRELNDDPKDGWMIRIESRDASCSCRIVSVHELQHTLHICKIDKEINLEE